MATRIQTVTRRKSVHKPPAVTEAGGRRTGKRGAVNPAHQTVPVSELAEATQRIRELERQLGRMALENAMLLEAVAFVGLPASQRPRTAAKRRKK